MCDLELRRLRRVEQCSLFQLTIQKLLLALICLNLKFLCRGDDLFLFSRHTCVSDTSFSDLLLRLRVNNQYILTSALQDTCTTCRVYLLMLRALTSSNILRSLVLILSKSYSCAHQVKIRILLIRTVRPEYYRASLAQHILLIVAERLWSTFEETTSLIGLNLVTNESIRLILFLLRLPSGEWPSFHPLVDL